jgi:xanthine dehydrogenase YagR molybdenum-binding subunit
MAQQPPPPAEAPKVKRSMKAGFAGSPAPLEINQSEGDIPPWDLDTKFKVVGGRHPRIDGPQKVTGRAKYTFDISLPGMLWGKLVQASVPAAEIKGIDTSAAEALPGVKAVWKTEARNVRFAGQDIAAVAATSPEVAVDAVRLIKVTYDERPFVTDLRKAIEPDAALVYETHQKPMADDETIDPAQAGPKRSGNVQGPIVPQQGGSRGDVDKGFLEADTTVEATYYVPTHTHSPLESHGVIAKWEGEELTLYASTQALYAVQDGVADALKLDRKNVTVLTEHMGGGFGSKLGPSATGSAFAMICARLAKQAGAPVKLMLDRREEHLCTGNAPAALMTVRIGAKQDGTFTAVHARSFGTAGIATGAGTSGPAVNLYKNCPNFKAENSDVFTNAGPAAPLRAPGHSQGAFALESAVDELAFKLGMDPLELRRKNESSPVRTMQYDLGAKAIGWERRNKDPLAWLKAASSGDAAAANPRKRGIGMANGNWYVFANDRGMAAECRIHRDGSVEVLTGCQDLGTGFRTAMTIVAAEELGLKPTDITIRLGDTRLPPGPGSGGSVTTNTVAPAVRLAAYEAKRKLFEVAAPILGAKPEDLDVANGKLVVAKNPPKALGFKQAAAKMSGESIAVRADRPKQFETYQGGIAGTQFAEVEVDVETGEVRVIKIVSVNDCGVPINALTTESQVIGSLIQGVSWALFEDRILDRNVGTMVNANLESYKVLAPKDMFEAQSILTAVANGGNNTSAAGIGEPPIVPTLGAVANAVFNATGARCRELPLTPDRVLAALGEARQRRA